jgi:ribosome biogenesis protein BMS1
VVPYVAVGVRYPLRVSGLINGSYPHTELHNLSLYISRMKFRPMPWRLTHPYLLVDRLEDVTNPVVIEQDPVVDRSVALYGFVRGAFMKPGSHVSPFCWRSTESVLVDVSCVLGQVHLAGVGDFVLEDVTACPDPVPLPETDPEKKKSRRSLNAKVTGVV